MSGQLVVLGVDSSLVAFGISLVEFTISGGDLGVGQPSIVSVHSEVITSKPDKSGAFTKGEDTSRRLRDAYRRLNSLAFGTADAIAVEATAFIGGRSSFHAIHGTARARQVVDDVGYARKVRVFEVSPSDVGKAATGRPHGKSPKEERILSLSERFPLFAASLASVKPSLVEHAADAFAVVLCALPRITRALAEGDIDRVHWEAP